MTYKMEYPMGVASHQSVANKAIYKRYTDALASGDASTYAAAALSIFASDADINVAHPINEVAGAQAYVDQVLKPMGHSFQGLQRREYVLIGGQYTGEEWVSSTGYYSGLFVNDWLGVPASQQLAYVRFGEFHKMEDGQIVQSYIFLGLAELIISLGLWPLAPAQGYEGVVPGPATQDGIRLDLADPARSEESGRIVDEMCINLATPDLLWRPYWDENMYWYGPGGLGSYVTRDAFQAFQAPFEQCFEGWGDGRADGIMETRVDCKAADGDYVFLSGWPTLTGVHIKPFMGIEATQKRIYIRDCDWWRCDGDKIMENWCMIDTLHLAHQLGRDVIAELKR